MAQKQYTFNQPTTVMDVNTGQELELGAGTHFLADTWQVAGSQAQEAPQPTPPPTQAPAQPTTLSQRVAATPGGLPANQNFVNAVFQAERGRDATAEELAQYTGKTVNEVRMGLAPTPEPTGEAFDAQELGTQKLTIPDYSLSTSDPDAFVAGITKLYEKLNTPTKEIEGLEETRDTYSNKYIALLEKQATRGARTLALEERFDIEQKAEAVAEMDGKIEQKIAEYNKLNEKVALSPNNTTGMIRGEQAYNQRLMAADVAILSAQKEVLLGKFNTAKDYVNRALEMEFGDIESQIANTKSFLEINKDRLTEAQAKMAEKNQLVMSAVESLIADQKAERERNYELMLEVAKAGGDTARVDMAKSYEENLANVGEMFVGVDDDINKLLTPNEAASLGVPYGTTRGQAMGLGIIPKTELTGVQKFTAEQNLAKQFESNVGDQRGAIRQLNIMQEGLKRAEQQYETKGDINAASQAILVTFQKILDPTSVVRESEYARSGDGQSLLNNLQGKYEKLERGGAGVTLESLREFVTTAEMFMGGYKQSMLDQATRIKSSADSQNLNINNILTPDVIRLLGETEQPQEITDEVFTNWLNTTYPVSTQAGQSERQKMKTMAEEDGLSIQEIYEIYNPDSFSRVDDDTNIVIGAGTLADRNNNPGNLRYVGQAGATQGEGGFARFESPQAGYEALKAQIQLDASRGHTLESFISKYAPPTENDTRLYLQQMIQATGATANTPVSQIDLETLARAMALKESSTKFV